MRNDPAHGALVKPIARGIPVHPESEIHIAWVYMCHDRNPGFCDLSIKRNPRTSLHYRALSAVGDREVDVSETRRQTS
jgi:hypothetical protein